MAETIKGINVAIGAETQGLQKALGDVNKAAKVSENELKQVEKLLKLDPSNVEMAAQKEELLTKAIEATKQKLTTLRDVQEEVTQQFKSGDITEGQYRAFQREIVKTEQALKDFESRAQGAEEETKGIGSAFQAAGTKAKALGDGVEKAGKKIEEVGEKVKGFGEEVKGFGEGYSTLVTAPIAAGTGAMFKATLDAETAQSKLRMTLGDTGKESERLGELGKKIWGSGWGESLDAVDGMLADIRMKVGAISDEDMTTLAKTGMLLEESFNNIDKADFTRAASVAMKNFKEDAKTTSDIMYTTVAKGGNYAGDLMDTISEYSVQFHALGLSFEESMNKLLIAKDKGAFNTDVVADSFKEFHNQVVAGNNTAIQSYAALGLNGKKMYEDIAAGGDRAKNALGATLVALDKIKDPSKQQALGTGIFGQTKWEDLRDTVIKSMDDTENKLGEFSGSAAKAAADAEANNPMMVLKGALRELSISMAPVMTDVIKFLKDDVVPAIKAVAGAFKAMPEPVQKSILTFGLILAAIGPLIMGIGSLVVGIGGSIAFFGKFGSSIGTVMKVFGGLSEVFGTVVAGVGSMIVPILIAVAVIGTLVAAGVFLYKHWDGIKAGAKALGTSIKNGFNDFCTTAGATLSRWGEGISKTWDNLTVATGTKVNQIASDVQTGFNTFTTNVSNTVAGWKNTVVTTFQQAGENAHNHVVALRDGVTARFDEITAATGARVAGFRDAVATGFQSAVGTVGQKMVDIKNAVIDGFSGFFSSAASIGGDLMRGLWQGINEKIGWITDNVASVARAITDTAKSILGIHSPSKVFADIGGNISKGLANGITGGADATKKAITGVVDGLTGAAMNVNIANGGAQAPAGPSNTVIINNPVPEKSDTSTRRALMKLAYLGVT